MIAHQTLVPRFLPHRTVAALLIGGGLLLFAAPVRTESAEETAARYVSPATVKAWVDDGRPVVFLDVREADEFAAGHLPGAINIVYDQVASIARRLPHGQPIVVYCIHSTHRAPEAAKTLSQLGFDNASMLEGCIVAWHAEGLTIRTSDEARPPTILPLTARCAELGANTTKEIR